MAVRNKKKLAQTKKVVPEKIEPQPQEVEEEDSEEQSEEETVPSDKLSDGNEESSDEEVDNPASSQESEQSEEEEDEEESKKTTIFVGHIKYDIAKEELEQFFGRAGEVKSVRIIPKRGFAFVIFADEKSVEKAMKFNNEKLKGREVHVEKVKTTKSNKKKEKKRKLDEENEEQKAKKAKLDQPGKKKKGFKFNVRRVKSAPGKNKPKKS